MRLRTAHSRYYPWLILGIGLLLSWGVEALSSSLSPFNLSLYIFGFWVAYPAIKLSFGRGLFIVLCIGFWLDASTPWPLGTQALWGVAGYVGVQFLRHKLREEADLPFLWVALLLNAFFVCLFAVLMSLGMHEKGSAYWEQIVLSLFLSELLIVGLVLVSKKGFNHQ